MSSDIDLSSGRYAAVAAGADPDDVDGSDDTDDGSDEGGDVEPDADERSISYEDLRDYVYTRYDMDAEVVTIDLADMWDDDPEMARYATQHADFLVSAANADMGAPVQSRPKTETQVKIVGTERERWSVGESPRDRVGTVVTVDVSVAARKGRTSVHPVVEWVCQRCGTRNSVTTSKDWGKDSPVECSGCEKEGPFKLAKDLTGWDYRELELEELPDQAEVDGDPESIRGEAVRESIVDDVSVPAGERVRITGILRTKEDVENKETPHYIDIRHCERLDDDGTIGELTEDDWDVINEIIEDPDRSLLTEIADTVHPTASRESALHGGILSVVGSPDGEQSGSRVRGDIHLMYVGDAGTGKSTLIDALTAITPKYAKTAGGTSSSVGLTASAVQDGIGMTDSGWVLRPGLLPRAHNGHLYLNEFDDVGSDSRTALNEALESGQVEVSKAGMSATFPAHTSLIASANPKYGNFRTDTEEPLADQLQFSTPILSRMDLIFPFVSEADWSSDMEMAENLLAGHASTDSDDVDGESGSTSLATDLTTDLIRRYISHVQDSVHPTIEPGSQPVQKLQQKYSKIREHASGRGLPIDPRTLQALARLSRAHARLRGSDVVAEEDVDVAVSLMESSLTQLDVLPETVRSDDVMDLRKAAAQATTSKPSQQERRDAIIDAVELLEDTSAETVFNAVSAEINIDRDTFDSEWDSLLTDGTLVLDADGNAEVFN